MEETEETPTVEEEDDAFLATTRKRKKVEATVIQRRDRRGDSDDDSNLRLCQNQSLWRIRRGVHHQGEEAETAQAHRRHPMIRPI